MYPEFDTSTDRGGRALRGLLRPHCEALAGTAPRVTLTETTYTLSYTPTSCAACSSEDEPRKSEASRTTRIWLPSRGDWSVDHLEITCQGALHRIQGDRLEIIAPENSKKNAPPLSEKVDTAPTESNTSTKTTSSCSCASADSVVAQEGEV